MDAFPLSVWIHLKMPGIKDGVPIVPGAVDDYSPVASSSSSSSMLPPAAVVVPASNICDNPAVGQNNQHHHHNNNSNSGDSNGNGGGGSAGTAAPPSSSSMSPAERSVRTASDRVKREKSIGKKEAGLNVLVHCHSLVSCQLNHFQYLFLMRQIDMLTELSSFLTNDTYVIYQTACEKNSWIRDIEDSLVISAIVPQVDVSFVIPPLHPTKDSMVGDMEGFVPDSSSTVGDVQEIDSLREMRGSTSDHSITLRGGAGVAPPTLGGTGSGGPSSALQIDAASGIDLSKSQSEGQLSATSGNLSRATDGTTTTYVQRTAKANSSVANNISLNSSHQTQPPQLPSVNLVSPTTKAAAGTTAPSIVHPLQQNQSSNVPAHSIQDNLNLGFSSMKKNFSNFMTSFETTAATAPPSSASASFAANKTSSPEDLSDTVSIQSDMSSDSENFVLLNIETNHLGGVGGGERSDSGLGMEAAFKADATRLLENSNIELASEALEEMTPSEEVSDVTSSFRRKNNVRDIIRICF